MYKGWRERLREAKKNGQRVKIIFEYPKANKAKVKRGKVLRVYQDTFELEEIKDGASTYKYDYVVEMGIYC